MPRSDHCAASAQNHCSLGGGIRLRGEGAGPRGPSSMERGSVNETISFGGVPVSPFDLIVGDDDGLVIVPRGRAEELLTPALARVQAEVEWEAALATGRSTIEVFNVPKAEKAQ